METANKTSRANALQVSAGQAVSTMEARFSARGLSRAVQTEAEQQKREEEKTRAAEPLSYRLSVLSEDVINSRYRGGKENMSGDDLLTYFYDTRAMRTREVDFSALPVDDDAVQSGESEKACRAVVKRGETTSVRKTLAELPARVISAPRRALETVRTSRGEWFNGQAADTSAEVRRFPVSAFAAIIAIAMSLLLIVASSVMVHQGESRVNSLSLEIDEVSSEVMEIRSDLDVNTDLLRIREIAVEDYGMVSVDFVRATYLTTDEEESIEVFEAEEEPNVGLAALLSAIGLK